MSNPNGSEGRKVDPETVELSSPEQADKAAKEAFNDVEGQLVQPADGYIQALRSQMLEISDPTSHPTSSRATNPEIVRELGLRDKLDQRLESLILAGELEYKNGIYSVSSYDSADGKEHIIDPKELLKESNLDLAKIEYAQENQLQGAVELDLPLNAFGLMNRLKQTLADVPVGIYTEKYATYEGGNFRSNKDAILKAATVNAGNRGVALMLTSGNLMAEGRGNIPQHLNNITMDEPISYYKGLTDIMLMLKQIFEARKRGENVQIPFQCTAMWDPNIEISGANTKGRGIYVTPVVIYGSAFHGVGFNANERRNSTNSDGVGFAVRINKS